MSSLWRGLVDLAIPRHCADCAAPLRERAEALCTRCARKLPWLEAEACVLCQECLVSEPGGICGACSSTPNPLRACVASSHYAGDVEDWVQRFKYPRSGLAGLDPRPEAVLRWLIREAATHPDLAPPELVVPVPLHPRRLRRRGFNPAGLLAKEVARASGCRAAPAALQRMRDTPSQTGLDRKQRRRNVAGAFRCKRSVPERVWIVDDVVTTGSTLSEAARCLHRAGAREVSAICVARTPAPR